MNFEYFTDNESIRFQTEIDGNVIFFENGLTAELYPEFGHVSVRIKPGPIPNLIKVKRVEPAPLPRALFGSFCLRRRRFTSGKPSSSSAQIPRKYHRGECVAVLDERIFVWARRRPQGIQRRIAKGVDEETSGNPPPKTVVSSILFTLPVVRNDFTGYCKREEKKDCSLYEEIFIIGLYEQKIILTITIMDYTTKIAHAKTVDDLLSHMPIVKFLASLSVTGVDPALPRNTSGFILR